MAVINKDDLIDDGSIKDGVKNVNDALKEMLGTLNGIIDSSKSYKKSVDENAGSTAKLKEDTQGLSKEQQELNKVNAQVATVNAKMNDEYIKQSAVLKDLQQQQKLKAALGDKEAIQVTALNSSITQLGVALNANRQAYSQLTNESQRNSAQGQQLLKVITQQREEFTKLQEKQGIFKENVGGYTESIEKAIPAFKKLNPELVEFGESLKAIGNKALTLLANPVVLAIAAIVASLGFLKKSFDLFTEGTVTGADRATVWATEWNTATELVTKQMKALGKTISDALENSGITEFFIKSLVYATGGANALAAYNVLLEKNLEINRLQNEIKKEEIVLSVESARLGLEKEKELNTAREKANLNLQERYEALQRGDEARIESAKLSQKAALNELELTKEIIGKKGIEINAQTDLNELFKDDLATKKLSYEQFELIAKSQKKLIDAQKEEYEGTRRIQALRTTLVEEQIKLITDEIKEERDAHIKLNEELIKEDQAKNARILANQSSTLEQRVEAEAGNAKDLIALNDKQTSDELFALREKGLQEIILDKKTNDEINAQAGNNLKLRAQLVLDAKNKEFDSEERFQSEVSLLILAGKKREEEIYKKSAENIVKITVDKAKQVAEAESADIGIAKDKALTLLNERLNNREISIVRYEQRRKLIEIQGEVDSLEAQMNGALNEAFELKSREQVQGQYAQDILKLKQKAADLELQIDDKKKERLKANLKEVYQLEKQFANAALDTIKTVGDNATQAQLDQLASRLQNLQDNEQKQLTLAGDNAQAKAQIEARFAAEQARIKKEEAKLKHDQAVRDKALDEAKIIINTAVAISEHLANPIAVGIIAALGALELAKVQSTPIPGYFTGTDHLSNGHPGGPAIVGERGPELITLPDNRIILSPSTPTVMDLPKGTEVMTNPETMRKLAMAGLRPELGGGQVQINLGEVTNEIKGLRSDMKKQKPHFPNYAKMASGVYEVRKESDTHTKMRLALSGNH